MNWKKERYSKIMKGSRVKIKKDSQFYGQSDEIGTVTEPFKDDWIRVVFDNGYQNSYRKKDLEKV